MFFPISLPVRIGRFKTGESSVVAGHCSLYHGDNKSNLSDVKWVCGRASDPRRQPITSTTRDEDKPEMMPVRIKRTLASEVDPKAALRAQVEQMPVEKQREFVMAAFQLLGDRIDLSKFESKVDSKLMS